MQFCRRVRAMIGGDVPWILVATGKSESQTMAAALDAGASDYITKGASEQLATRLTIAERGARHNQKRQAVEAEILRSKRELVEIVDRLPIGIAIPDGDGIVYCNRVWSAFFAAEAGAPRSVMDAVHPDERERFARYLAERSMTPAEFHLNTKRQTLVEVTLGEIFAEDDTPRVLIAARDVTEFKQMQSSLIASDRLASIGTLAAGVAHEINNPLAYVIANLGYLNDQLGEVTPEVREVLAETRAGADRVRAIVRDLKTFSRSDDTVKKSIDVRAVMESSINMA